MLLSECQFSSSQIEEPWLVYADKKYRILIPVSLSHKLTTYSYTKSSTIILFDYRLI